MKFPYSHGRTLNMMYPSKFASIVQESSRRALTNQQDVLRVLAGLIRRSSKGKVCDFLYGIPLDDLLDYWTFKGDNRILSRREGFPSYSWAGWQGSTLIPTAYTGLSSWIHLWITSPKTGQRRGPFRKQSILREKLAQMKLPTDVLYHLSTTEQPPVLESRPFDTDKSPPMYLRYEMLEVRTICQTSRAFVYVTVRAKAHRLDYSGTVQGVVNLDGFNDGDDAYWELIKTECF